jgi:peptidoglycan/xylan/chitin deacetylase (PgdA/CDA1 family)
VNDGHEIAHHGYTHAAPDPADPRLVAEELDRGLEALEQITGKRPVGYRPPDGVSSELSLRLLTERGFLYNSCFKDDFVPYRHLLADGAPGPVEVPEQPTLDDWAYGSSSLSAPRPLFPKEAVLSIWRDEFHELYDWGAAITIVMHPQISGRPMRLATLRDFIAYTRRFDRVWYATCTEIASAFVAHEATSP